MKVVQTGWDRIFGPWWAEKCNGSYHPGVGHFIGLFDFAIGAPVASCYFEGCNGKSIRIHIASEGKNWLNREFLWYCFYYPFEELKLYKVIGLVEGDNDPAVRFVEHLGFKLEATLKDACPKGNLHIYTMTKEQCRWLSLKRSYEQTQSPGTA